MTASVQTCHCCSLLCHYTDVLVCSRRDNCIALATRAHLIRHSQKAKVIEQSPLPEWTRDPHVLGKPTDWTTAIAFADEQLLTTPSKTRLWTGSVKTVETSRALIDAANLFGGIVDVQGSDDAFDSIRATQRAGTYANTLSEIRYRSDCIIIVGHDRLLATFPRLPKMLKRSPNKDSEIKQRIVLMGDWSDQSMSAFRNLNFDIRSIPVAVRSIPTALREWSRLSSEDQRAGESIASNWMYESTYLSVLYGSCILPEDCRDIWLEDLQRWLIEANGPEDSSVSQQSPAAPRRVAGLLLSDGYQTFQNVSLWKTGFAGRYRLPGEARGASDVDRTTQLELIHDPERFTSNRIRSAAERHYSIIQVDDTIEEAEELSIGGSPCLRIAPAMTRRSLENSSTAPRVYLPCAAPSWEINASYFRTDSVFATRAKGASKVQQPTGQLLPAWEILRALSVNYRQHRLASSNTEASAP